MLFPLGKKIGRKEMSKADATKGLLSSWRGKRGGKVTRARRVRVDVHRKDSSCAKKRGWKGCRGPNKKILLRRGKIYRGGFHCRVRQRGGRKGRARPRIASSGREREKGGSLTRGRRGSDRASPLSERFYLGGGTA